MNTFTTWGEAIRASLQDLWFKFINAVPNIIGAIIILMVGFFLAGLLSDLVRRVIRMLGIDAVIERSGVQKRMEAVGIHFGVGNIIAWLVKWFIIIATLTAVADILHWAQVTDFLARVAAYIPNIFVAIVILIVGMVIGRFLQQLVRGAVTASRLPSASSGLLATVAEWSVIIFALMAAMTQLGIATRLIEILFTGLVAGLSLAFGLAFGLGGREQAMRWIGKIDQEIKANPDRM